MSVSIFWFHSVCFVSEQGPQGYLCFLSIFNVFTQDGLRSNLKLLSFIVGVKMEGLCHRLASRCVEKFCSVFRAVMSLSTVHNSCCQVNLVLSQCSSLAVVIQR